MHIRLFFLFFFWVFGNQVAWSSSPDEHLQENGSSIPPSSSFSPNQAIASKGKPKIDTDQRERDSFYLKVKRVNTGQSNPPQNELKRQKVSMVEHETEEVNPEYLKELDRIEKEYRERKVLQIPTPTSAPVRKQEDRVVKRKAERNRCRLKPIRGKEHFQLLKNLIRSAKDEILITTKSIGFIPDSIIDSLRYARNRRVKISVYSNKEPNDWMYDFFEVEGIHFEQLNIHGKHLIIDRSCAVIGSCNWLGFSDEGIGSGERSIKISGNHDYIKQLRGRIYSALIKYRKIYYNKMNDEPSSHIEFDKLPLDLPLNTSSRMLLLTTLQHHEDYLRLICKDAKKNIRIYSPFVIFPIAVKRLNMIAEGIKKDVKLHIFLNKYDLIERTREGYDSISNFIKSHPKLKGKTTIKPLRIFHRKTLIVDNETRSEGSFNWLSSALSMESDFHNQDTSLVIQGPIVRDLVQRKRPPFLPKSLKE